MKSGLKDADIRLFHVILEVTTSTAMKSGLKVYRHLINRFIPRCNNLYRDEKRTESTIPRRMIPKQFGNNLYRDEKRTESRSIVSRK